MEEYSVRQFITSLVPDQRLDIPEHLNPAKILHTCDNRGDIYEYIFLQKGNIASMSLFRQIEKTIEWMYRYFEADYRLRCQQ